MPKMPKDTDILSLLKDEDFMFTWVEYPSLVKEQADAILERLEGTYPTTSNSAKPAYSIVGSRQLRHMDLPRLKGTAIYTHDVAPEGTLYAAILYSAAHAHAKITAIDTSQAEKLAGVRAVVTYKNIYSFGAEKHAIYTKPDRFILQDEVFYPGDEVAGVAADTQDIANAAIKLINVTYAPLPAFFGNPEDGAKPGAPQASPDGNLPAPVRTIKIGDVDAAFKASDVITEGRYETPTLQHAPLETKSIVVLWDDDQMNLWVSSQHAHGARSKMAAYLSVPIAKVQAICNYMGGGFGDKSSNSVDRFAYIAAVLSKMTGKPVKLHYSRREEFSSSVHKAANVMYLKTGVKRDGTLLGFQVTTYSDQGAWNGASGSAQSSQEGQQTLYQYQAARFDQYNTFTNRYRTGPMRDVNESSGSWSMAVHMDRVAEQLGMDPVDFHLKNVTRDKSPFDGNPWTSNGIRECITRGAAEFNWKARWHKPAGRIVGRKANGVGMGIFASQKGSQSAPMSGIVKIERDGSVSVITGAQEIGGGQSTTMMMIAAEELGADLERCQVYGGDSALTSETGVTAGSRQTKSGGTGILMAARDAKRQLFTLAITPSGGKTILPATSIDQLDSSGGFVFLKSDPTKRASFATIMASIPNVIIASATVIPPRNVAQRSFGASFTELEIDLDTAEVTVLDYLAAHDVGKVINRLGIEQQFDGGLLMGMGFALSEALKVDPQFGFSVNSTYENYAMATSLDVPLKTRPLWIETIDSIGPFGAKGMGEPACTCPPPSVANAIYNAIGVRIYEVPASRERLLKAIAQAKL
ncbi:MAG TPA: xanthine dehydrogenase family protein molybdopterin-binding subunit [Candidatus Limnocylindria bacterium]|nr:xanthine dehydrogenase family protein molybdopterin-binding subunit [Candidatus Limnocylindria bacterium]